eukprot:219697-Pleurochrysis_carterae.AAC.1
MSPRACFRNLAGPLLRIAGPLLRHVASWPYAGDRHRFSVQARRERRLQGAEQRARFRDFSGDEPSRCVCKHTCTRAHHSVTRASRRATTICAHGNRA